MNYQYMHYQKKTTLESPSKRTRLAALFGERTPPSCERKDPKDMSEEEKHIWKLRVMRDCAVTDTRIEENLKLIQAERESIHHTIQASHRVINNYNDHVERINKKAQDLKELYNPDLKPINQGAPKLSTEVRALVTAEQRRRKPMIMAVDVDQLNSSQVESIAPVTDQKQSSQGIYSTQSQEKGQNLQSGAENLSFQSGTSSDRSGKVKPFSSFSVGETLTLGMPQQRAQSSYTQQRVKIQPTPTTDVCPDIFNRLFSESKQKKKQKKDHKEQSIHNHPGLITSYEYQVQLQTQSRIASRAKKQQSANTSIAQQQQPISYIIIPRYLEPTRHLKDSKSSKSSSSTNSSQSRVLPVKPNLGKSLKIDHSVLQDAHTESHLLGQL